MYPKCSTKRGPRVVDLSSSPVSPANESASSRALRIHPSALCLLRHSQHTTAVHLLRAGVDINTIRAWLGHVSLETTNRYAEIDLEMKAKALQTCAVTGSADKPDGTPSWHADSELMSFLSSL